MDRASRLAPMVALLLCLPATVTGPAPTDANESVPADLLDGQHRTDEPLAVMGAGLVTVDLLDGPLPADEPEAARQVLTCALSDAGLCDELAERLLELPFAWHRTGYTVELADGADARGCGSYRVTGLTRAASREIVVYVHWADTVRDLDGAFRGVRRTLAHEIGHVMHQTCGEETVLEAWRTARGIPADAPLRGHGEGHFSSVAEDFADMAMAWLTDAEFTVRSAIERERFRTGLSGSADAAHEGGPGARR
jgi:hypothetical protein